MQPKRAAAAALIASVVALAGCSDTVNGTPQSSSGGNTFPKDIHGLGARLLQGNSSIKSAHLTLNETAGATTVDASGDEKLSDGKVQAMDLSETVNNLALRFIIIGTNVYAHLPASIHQSTKPWVQISPTTTDPELQQLYTSFQQAEQTGTGDTVNIFVKAGKNLKFKGTTQTGGVTVGDYTLSVDVPSLPSDFPNKDMLIQGGLSTIPVELFLDEQGRTRKFTEHIAFGGQTVDAQATLTKLDEPVSISAPPPDQVEPG